MSGVNTGLGKEVEAMRTSSGDDRRVCKHEGVMRAATHHMAPLPAAVAPSAANGLTLEVFASALPQLGVLAHLRLHFSPAWPEKGSGFK